MQLCLKYVSDISAAAGVLCLTAYIRYAAINSRSEINGWIHNGWIHLQAEKLDLKLEGNSCTSRTSNVLQAIYSLYKPKSESPDQKRFGMISWSGQPQRDLFWSPLNRRLMLCKVRLISLRCWFACPGITLTLGCCGTLLASTFMCGSHVTGRVAYCGTAWRKDSFSTESQSQQCYSASQKSKFGYYKLFCSAQFVGIKCDPPVGCLVLQRVPTEIHGLMFESRFSNYPKTRPEMKWPTVGAPVCVISGLPRFHCFRFSP